MERMEAGREESPQRRWKCACPSWTTPRECAEIRATRATAPDDIARHSEKFRDLLDEWCECACHERDEDDDDE